jgi:hypothetical protein
MFSLIKVLEDMSLEFSDIKKKNEFDKLVLELDGRVKNVQKTQKKLMSFLANNKPIDEEGLLKVAEEQCSANRSSRKVSKTKVLINISPGVMKLPGKNGSPDIEYHIHYTQRKRRTILNKLITEKTALKIYRTLLARRTLGKTKLSPEQKNTLTQDAKYIKDKYYGKNLWNNK